MVTSKTRKIYAKKTIAYASMLNGVEIKDIEHGIKDYVICISNAWYDRENMKSHRVKIYYEDRPYFIIRGTKIYLDECTRALNPYAPFIS